MAAPADPLPQSTPAAAKPPPAAASAKAAPPLGIHGGVPGQPSPRSRPSPRFLSTPSSPAAHRSTSVPSGARTATAPRNGSRAVPVVPITPVERGWRPAEGRLELDFEDLLDWPFVKIEKVGTENIRSLDLIANKLETIPGPHLARLTALEALWLNTNRLAALPREIRFLARLKVLEVQSNQLEALPREIALLGCLETLGLFDNRLTFLPPEIGSLPRLQRLSVGENRLQCLPPELGRLANLVCLLAGGNELTTLPEEVGRLTKLRTMNIACNRILSLPPMPPSLRAVYLADNPIVESFPPLVRAAAQAGRSEEVIAHLKESGGMVDASAASPGMSGAAKTSPRPASPRVLPPLARDADCELVVVPEPLPPVPRPASTPTPMKAPILPRKASYQSAPSDAPSEGVFDQCGRFGGCFDMAPSKAPPGPVPRRPHPLLLSRCYDAFLSYAPADQTAALRYADRLVQAGIRIWVDRDARAGRLRTQTVADAICDSHTFVPFVSPAYAAAKECFDEIRFAHGSTSAKKIPVLLQDADTFAIPHELRFLLSRTRWVTQKAPGGAAADAACEELAAVIREHVRTESAQPPIVATALPAKDKDGRVDDFELAACGPTGACVVS